METKSPSDSVRVAWLRQIAKGVSLMQHADALLIHADRDMCTTCINTYMILVMRAAQWVPAELLADDDWVHRHITGPGTRIAVRVDDAIREGAHRGW